MGKSIKQKLMEVMPLVILNIGLPTGDVFSDILTIITLYMSEHPYFATALLTPFLFNVVFTTFSWWRIDSNKEKKWTWILLLLQLWPQYRAMKIIFKIFKGDPSYVNEKNTLERDVSILEPFLESVPTVWITTVILAKQAEPENNYALGKDVTIFITSFTLSVISSSIGITKFLKVGPCKIFPEGGSCLGYLTGRFMMVFIAVACSVVNKGLMVSSHLLINVGPGPSRGLMSTTGVILCFLVVNILPNLLWSIVLVSIPLRNMKRVFLTLKTYPQIFLVAMFTPFAFGAKTISCRNCPETASGRITFTKQGTVVNLIITVTSFVITESLYLYDDLKGRPLWYVFVPPAIIILILQTILTIAIMINSECCCGSRNQECCALQYHYLSVPTGTQNTNEVFEFGVI